jgi:hypothetical protein
MKYYFVSLLTVIVLLFSSCSLGGKILKDGQFFLSVDSNGSRVLARYSEDDQFKYNISKKILDCFSEKNADGLMTLFCAKTKNLSDTAEQILEALSFFEGIVVSFDENILGAQSKSIEYGKTLLHEEWWTINEILTNMHVKYEIRVNIYRICEEDEDREGVSRISIKSDKGIEVIVGYEWPRHYNEGRDLSIEIIRKFDEKDSNGLRNLFCDKSLESPDIEQQFLDAFDFYEGKDTKGKVRSLTGHEYYDGKLSWNCTVSDKEVVKESKPVATSILTRIVNINTTAKKKYEIQYYACLLDKNEESNEGISQMIITHNKEKRIIGALVE